jgi:hypothetical protein
MSIGLVKEFVAKNCRGIFLEIDFSSGHVRCECGGALFFALYRQIKALAEQEGYSIDQFLPSAAFMRQQRSSFQLTQTELGPAGEASGGFCRW